MNKSKHGLILYAEGIILAGANPYMNLSHLTLSLANISLPGL